MKIVMVKVGSQYVTDGGGLSPNQGDALRIVVPQSGDPNVPTPNARIVSLKTRD
jgi:hypothetical protein